MHNTYAFKKVRKSDALAALLHLPTYGSCATCKHATEVIESETMGEKAVSLAHQLGRKIGMDGDKVQRRGKVIVLSWKAEKCSKTKQYCMPKEIMHNCHFYESKPTVTVNDDEWYMD